MMAVPARGQAWTREALAVLALLLLTLIPRLIWLGADPPHDFATGWLADEGAWAHNARQHLLFGRWVLDEVNPGMFATPLYSVVLESWYRLVGIGLVQSRLLSALSGFLACLLFYVALRARLSIRCSLPPALVLGLSYLLLSHNRVALTESFQLCLIMATVAAMFHAFRRPGWALAGGVFFVGSVLAKPSAGVMGLVLLVFWLVHLWLSRRRDFVPPFSFHQPIYFAVAILVTGAIVSALVVLPHWDAISQQLGISLRNVYGDEARASGARVSLLGWDGLGLSMNGFMVHCFVLLVAVVIFAVARIGRAVDQRMEVEELFCWVWFGVGLLFLATQRFQPERRFLLLIPPLAFLASHAVRIGGLRIPGRPAFRAAGRSWRSLAAGALLGACLGFYLQNILLSRSLGIAPGNPGTRAALAVLLWSGATVLGALGAFLWARRLPLTAVSLPAWVLIAAFLFSDPVLFALYLKDRRFAAPAAIGDFRELTRNLHPADKTVVGTSADGLALDSDLYAFSIRYRPGPGSFLNLNGWDRFHPSLAVVVSPPGRGPMDLEQQRILAEARRRGFTQVAEFVTRYDRRGRVTYVARVYARPGLFDQREKSEE